MSIYIVGARICIRDSSRVSVTSVSLFDSWIVECKMIYSCSRFCFRNFCLNLSCGFCFLSLCFLNSWLKSIRAWVRYLELRLLELLFLKFLPLICCALMNNQYCFRLLHDSEIIKCVVINWVPWKATAGAGFSEMNGVGMALKILPCVRIRNVTV